MAISVHADAKTVDERMEGESKISRRRMGQSLAAESILPKLCKFSQTFRAHIPQNFLFLCQNTVFESALFSTNHAINTIIYKWCNLQHFFWCSCLAYKCVHVCLVLFQGCILCLVDAHGIMWIYVLFLSGFPWAIHWRFFLEIAKRTWKTFGYRIYAYGMRWWSRIMDMNFVSRWHKPFL